MKPKIDFTNINHILKILRSDLKWYIKQRNRQHEDSSSYDDYNILANDTCERIDKLVEAREIIKEIYNLYKK